MTEVSTQVTPSAQEINRRVREIEWSHVLPQTMPYAERRLNGDAPGPLKELVRPNGATESPGAIPSEPSPHGHPPPRIKGRMPWYLAVMCGVGIHQGQWNYTTEGWCTQTRKCQRCECTSVQTEHAWGEESVIRGESWWKGDKQAHKCTRCGQVQTWTEADD